MRRSLIMLPVLAVSFLLAACGGYTPAEEAFLADVQEGSSEIKLSDPDKHLERGHAMCEAAKDTKPADRKLVAFMSAEKLGWLLEYDAARTKLCPELLGG